MSIDISALWDFGKPELSETRFRDALIGASEDDQIILQTQIARTFGLRKDFEKTREILAEVEPKLDGASSEAKVRYWIELGRSYCSTTHPKETQTDAVKELGHKAYMNAFESAKAGRLDALAVDALHMMTMVDTAPDAQIEWNYKALAYMDGSSQEDAKKWEGSLRNNLGYALHLAGRYEEAIVEFNLSLAAYQKAGRDKGVRYAKWMVAWTLRAMEKYQEALEMQLALEKEWDEAGDSDSYVFEELGHLYKALGDESKADFYASRAK